MIQVEDADLNVQHDVVETAECRCSCGESVLEHVVLKEEGLNSFRFTGHILTADIFDSQSAAAPSAAALTTYTGMPADPYTAFRALAAQQDFEAVGADIVCEYLDVAPRSRRMAKAHILASDGA